MTTPPSASTWEPHEPCPAVTRRRFLTGLGAGVAVLVAGGRGLSVWTRDPAHAAPAPAPGSFGSAESGRTLVVIEMGGGNDGLNTVVPHASARYYDLRNDLAIAEPLDLDGEIGFHPTLGSLATRYRAGNVALVEGVGYPDPDLSHFASMSAWWSGLSATYGSTGWLGRYLDGTVGDTDPLAAIAIGPGPSPALLADRAFSVTIQDETGLSPTLPPWIDDTDELVGTWGGFAAGDADTGLLGRVHEAIAGTVAAASQLGEILPATGAADQSSRGSVGDSLNVAARLIGSGLAPRVIVVHGFGDFDTHQGQSGRHETLLSEIDTALDSFFTTIEGTGRGDDVVVMTTSEFGRRAASNGSGTDHGTAAGHFVIGSPVRGGRYGEAPNLAALDSRGNLVHTLDVRSYYATILDGWLGVDHACVLGSRFETLPIFSGGTDASSSGRFPPRPD